MKWFSNDLENFQNILLAMLSLDSTPDPAHQPQLYKGFNNLITVEYHQQQKTVNVNVHKVNAEYILPPSSLYISEISTMDTKIILVTIVISIYNLAAPTNFWSFQGCRVYMMASVSVCAVSRAHR